jgi:hypothetical protein
MIRDNELKRNKTRERKKPRIKSKKRKVRRKKDFKGLIIV